MDVRVYRPVSLNKHTEAGQSIGGGGGRGFSKGFEQSPNTQGIALIVCESVNKQHCVSVCKMHGTLVLADL